MVFYAWIPKGFNIIKAGKAANAGYAGKQKKVLNPHIQSFPPENPAYPENPANPDQILIVCSSH
jgi:hypothetical protein